MTLREVTRAVISLVESASGCQVIVSEDRSLKTLAAARIARGTNKIHLMSYMFNRAFNNPVRNLWCAFLSTSNGFQLKW